MGRQHTQTDIDQALFELVHSQDNAQAASEALSDAGLIVSPKQITQWKRDLPDRYERARESLTTVLAAKAEDLALKYGQAEMLAVDLTLQQLERAKNSERVEDSIDARDLSVIGKNLATARGISTQNANLMRGRPTTITENRDSQAILRELAARLGLDKAQPAIDTTAEEVPDETLPAPEAEHHSPDCQLERAAGSAASRTPE